MSWTLGGITLKNPVSFTRRQVEIAKSNVTLNGVSKKDFIRQKEIFEVGFNSLTQTQVNQLVGLYEGKTAVAFAVSETNLTITSTQVFITYAERKYNIKGNEYREDIILRLEEV